MVKIYQKMMQGMTDEAKNYYIKLGVNFGDLTKIQAGYLTYINNLLK